MKIIIKWLLSLFLIANLNAQELGESILNLSQGIATSYLAPVIAGYGANMNSGWITKVVEGKLLSLDIEAGIMFMGAFIGGADKTFSKDAKVRLTNKEADLLTEQYNSNPVVKNALINALTSNYVDVRAYGPTITGSIAESLKVDFSGRYVEVQPGVRYYVAGKTFTYPVTGLLDDVKFLITFAPQMSVGTLGGTLLTLRYVPGFMFPQGSLGSSYYFGTGIQHNPFVWFGRVPFNLSLAGFYQRLNIENIIKTHDFRTGLFIGKTFGTKLIGFNIYGGASYEYSKIYVDYNYSREGYSLPLSFTMIGDNKFRGTIGCGLQVVNLRFNADINIARLITMSAGIKVGL